FGLEAVEELVGPAVVLVGDGAAAVGERVAEHDHTGEVVGGQGFRAGQEVPVVDRGRAGQVRGVELVAVDQVRGGPGAGMRGDVVRGLAVGEVAGDRDV